MNKLFYLLSFIAFNIESTFCWNSNNIIDLTENNYNSALVQYQSLIVLFHDNSVEESHRLLNEFEKSVRLFKQIYFDSIGFAKVLHYITS